MNRHTLLFVIATAITAVTTKADAQELVRTSAVYPAVRTAREQALTLARVGIPWRRAAPAMISDSGVAARPVLERVERSIRLVNVHDPETLRRPVPADELLRLRGDLAQRFRLFLSATDVQAMTDYAQTLRRESPGKSLSVKLIEGLNTERPTLFGLVVELPEARARGMVLTRNKQSRTFDLTEARRRPRSAQMKIYRDEPRAVRDMLVDLQAAPRRMRHGIATRAALEQAETIGLIRERPNPYNNFAFYEATDGSRTVFMESMAFDDVASARKYVARGEAIWKDLMAARRSSVPRLSVGSAGVAQSGFALWLLAESAPLAYEDVMGLRDPGARSEETYLRLGQHSMEAVAAGALLIDGGIGTASTLSHAVAQSSRLMAVSQWASSLGWVSLAAMEGVEVWEWNAGYKTDRDFYRRQAQLGGILLGGTVFGWAGAQSGALAGGFVGAWFGPEGVPLGAAMGFVLGGLAGGTGGAYLSSWAAGCAASSYFEFRDRQAEAEYVRFVYSHYAMP